MRLVLSLSLACGVVAQAQDTVRVKAGRPLWGTSVGLKQLYMLGGPPEYDFGAVHATAVDRFNRVYVFDIMRPQVRAYDANGKFLRVIGRVGAGPGEYRIALGATIVQDSVLAVYDPTALRVVYFNPDGTHLRTQQFRRPLTLNSGMLRSDSAGHFYFKATFVGSEDGRSPTPLPPARQQYIRVASDGRFVDSLPIPQFVASPEPRFNSMVARGSMMESPAAAIVFGRGDTYRFTIQSFGGGRPRVVEKAWQPIPLDGEERAQVIARAEENSRRDPQHASFNIPRTKPAYREIFVDQDGRIWISLFAGAEKRNLPRDTSATALPPLDWRESPTWDVFDPAGKYFGQVVLPYGAMLWAARNDRVYAKSIGPEGEERLIAYQITGIQR